MLPFRAGKFFRDFPDFLHRPNGVRELPQACSPFPGGEFSAEPQRGDSPSADGGSVAAPAAGTTPYPRRWAKRKDNLRFSFLFELLPFPCFLIWRRFPICDRSEMGVRQRIFSTVSFATCSQCQIHYCYTDQKTSAGRGIAVPRLLEVADLCSRTLSVTANMSRHGSTLCSPTVEKILCRTPFRSGHMSVICARPSPNGSGS